MTSDRPYRRGTSYAAATEEIIRCSGQQFDPRIVQVFLSLPEQTWTDLRDETEGSPPLFAPSVSAIPRLHSASEPVSIRAEVSQCQKH